MNIGIIASSHGSVFIEVYNLLKRENIKKYHFFIVLDRKTKLLDFCIQNNLEHIVVEKKDNKDFSMEADSYFSNKNISMVILFFLRLVTKDIFNKYFTINVHPSILPAYKGLNVIERVIADNHKYMGATIHQVNEQLDGGIILLQTLNVIQKYDVISLQKISFMQKVLLFTILFDYMENNSFTVDTGFTNICYKINTSPFFCTRKFLKAFQFIQDKENCRIIEC